MTPAEIFADALLAAALLAVDPDGLGGIAIRAQAGPVRDQYLASLPGPRPRRRLPAGIADDALLGGLDVGATLQAGRPLRTRGLLDESRGGTLVAAMAERMTSSLAARLAGAMDGGGGFCLVLLDEGIDDDERPASALLDRVAFHIDLSTVGHRDAGAGADHALLAGSGAALAGAGLEDGVTEALCGAAQALGILSARAPLLALRTARAAAVLAGRTSATLEDAALAARLVLAPRATMLPRDSTPERQPEPPDEAPRDGRDTADDASGVSDATDIVLEAVRAVLPADLLAHLQSRGGQGPQKSHGAAGIKRRGMGRGRPVGVRPGLPGAGARLNLIETLRAAAPWQRLRARADRGGPALRRDDFRIVRTEAPDRSTTIFLVDASGSAAANRLAEAKGAVELLLADCYRRRDEVAVISFRGQGAQLLLPPTRSLVRARRSLAGLPGGGGTPLAAGLDAGVALAEQVRRGGTTPTLVVLTDGRANVTRAGNPGRALAREEALAASRRVRAAGFATILLDTAARPAPDAASLAAAMGARYVPMPYPSAAGLSRAIGGGLTPPARWEAATNWPNRACSRFVRAGGVDWHVQVAGDGPALLLVHGTGASTHSWRDIFPSLAARFTVVAPDLPGHGFSDVGARHALSLPAMARDLGALLRELRIAPVLAAGHSAGAPILARMCLDGSIAPAGLVSLNGAFLPLGGPAGQVFAPLARLLVGLPVLPQLFAWRAGDPRVVQRLLTGTGSRLDATGVALYTQLVRNPGHAAAALRMMASWDLPPLVRDLPRLAPILLLVAGEGDLAIPPADAARVAALVPGARVVTWPGLGHLAHEEDAPRAVALIEAFARELGVL